MASRIRRPQEHRPSGDYFLELDNGVPFQLVAYNTPTAALNATDYLGLYLTDSWTIARRLTLNLGTRYAHDVGFVPPQCRDAGPFAAAGCTDRIEANVWNSISPRISVAYNVTGDGKTAIKGGWGRFDHMRKVDEIFPLNPFYRSETTYRWRDLNGNLNYDPGEVNLDPNGADFVSVRAVGGGVIGAVPDPNEPQPTIDQFYASFERELLPSFAVRVTGISSRYSNVPRVLTPLRPYEVYNIPITNPDPGPDGVLRTADDPGTFITYWDFPVAYRGRTFDSTMRTVPSGQPNHTFNSVEIAASRRLSNNWQFMASYSATKKHIVPAQERTAFNPNVEIFAEDNTWEWMGRASGAYVFPYAVTFSMNYEHRSGDAQARQVLFRGGQQVPSIVLNVEPIGSLRMPNFNFVDLRVEKAFRLGSTQKLSARLNIYNVLNSDTITERTVRAGANFLRPTAILPPRMFEVAASYSF
jgi:hypothetical protein